MQVVGWGYYEVPLFDTDHNPLNQPEFSALAKVGFVAELGSAQCRNWDRQICVANLTG